MTSEQIESKEINYKSFEFKAQSLNEDNDYFYFEGYASTFGNVDSYGDIVMKGAFTDSLKQRMPVLLEQHRADKPLGVCVSAAEDEIGLFVKVMMPKANTNCQNNYALLKCGAINSLSIGYIAVKWNRDEQKNITYLEKLDLFEFSVVTFPANPMAKITAVKSIEEFNCMKDIERFLKNPIPLSKDDRKIFISKIKSFSSLRDVDSQNKVTKEKEQEIEGRDVSDVSEKACQQLVADKINQLINIYTGEHHDRPESTKH